MIEHLFNLCTAQGLGKKTVNSTQDVCLFTVFYLFCLFCRGVGLFDLLFDFLEIGFPHIALALLKLTM